MTRFLPGARLGFLGGGQLARMMAMEARCMGYRIAVLDAQADAPATQLADIRVTGALDDPEAAARLADASDIVTLDTEHVPAAVIERIETLVSVRPSSRVMRTVQDRIEQRRFLDSLDAPQVAHAAVIDADSLAAAAAQVRFPAVLKTAREGYDGKGQVRVAGEAELAAAWRSIGETPAVLESFVEFDQEISALLARDLQGNIVFHPCAGNLHRHHILHTSRVPSGAGPAVEARARELAGRIAAALDHVGMMAVELFVTGEGELLVNEIAPRTHNSGHYSFGACATSQFAQHVRAVCGLPLADPGLLSPAVMLNLLGDLWANGEPDWDFVLSHPGAHLHLYGKSRVSPGRKMGHILCLGEDVAEAQKLAERVFDGLVSRAGA